MGVTKGQNQKFILFFGIFRRAGRWDTHGAAAVPNPRPGKHSVF